jgi:2-methylcitrate dehydratase PrpD
VNALMAHVCDFDDTYVPSLTHPSAAVMGAALDRVKENLGAAEVRLSDEDMAAIEARLARIEVTGERLPPAILKVTNG